MNDPIEAGRAARDKNGLAGAKQTAADWVDRADGKLDQARQPVADKLRGTADAIRQQAQSLFEREGISEGVSDVAHGAADRVESSAAYLESHDVSQMARDVTGVVKRYPLQSLLVAAALGFLCGRAFRSH